MRETRSSSGPAIPGVQSSGTLRTLEAWTLETELDGQRSRVQHDERRRRPGQRDVELAQSLLAGRDERRLDDDHVIEFEPLGLPWRQQRDAVERALVRERGLDELVRDDQRDEAVL